MAHEAEAAPLPPESGLANALADGYATVHELETRSLQLKRHCEALVAAGADAEQVSAVMRARQALSRELEGLRDHLDKMRRTSR
jgi:hypothetical protein